MTPDPPVSSASLEQQLRDIIDAELSKAGYRPAWFHRTEFYADFERIAKAVYAAALAASPDGDTT